MKLSELQKSIRVLVIDMAKTRLGAGVERHIEFPEGTACRMYEEHKKLYGDYNILGQIYRLECQITKTNFDDTESLKELKRVAREVGKTLIELSKD